MDYQELFDDIAEQLVESGFGFVVREVEEELAAGILLEKRAQSLSEVVAFNDSAPTRFRSTGQSDYIERVEYSKPEALALLIEAVRRSTVEAMVMTSDIFSFMETEGLTGLRFLDDDDRISTVSVEQKGATTLALARQTLESLDVDIEALRSENAS